MPTFCVPAVANLPGSPASDFDWWLAAPDPNLIRYYPDNPNWLGAFGLSAGDGANEDVKFRVLKGNFTGKNYLLMQWVVRTSTLSNTIDRVNVLLGPPGGPYLAFNARLNQTSTTAASPPGTENNGVFVYMLQSCSVGGGGVITAQNPAVTANGDLETTGRMWVDVTSPTRNLHTDWAFQVAVELGTNWGALGLPTQLNLPASGAFKMWFEVWSSIGGMAVPQQWPTTSPQTTGVLQLIPPGITEAQLFDMSTAGAGCTDAVKLSSVNVGTRAAPGGTPRANTHTIQLDLGKPYPPLTPPPPPYPETHTPNVSNVENQNQFFAGPTFPGGMSTAQKEAVRATFSLANWGSQFSTPTPQSWRPIPGGANTPFINANGECHFVWPSAGEDTSPTSFVTVLVRNINRYLNAWSTNSPFPAGSQNPHQCMLVELSSLDPTVIITTSSVFANMNIADASTFRRFAEISVVGAPPISAAPRDVFLYVQKFNMPAVAPPKGEEPPRVTANIPGFAAAASTGGPRGNEVEDIAASVPTLTIHGYMDTGKKLKLADGSQVPILRRQTAFGYFVQHKGDLHGWESRLYGAEKLSENLYVVRVPNNGSVHVETAIQARESANETPLPPDGRPAETLPKPQGCLGAILHLFGWKK